MRNFAYFIMAGGQKIVGGTVSADDMGEAAKKLVRREGLRVVDEGAVIRPCDGAVIPCAHFELKGRKVSMAVWVRPEDFIEKPTV